MHLQWRSHPTVPICISHSALSLSAQLTTAIYILLLDLYPVVDIMLCILLECARNSTAAICILLLDLHPAVDIIFCILLECARNSEPCSSPNIEESDEVIILLTLI